MPLPIIAVAGPILAELAKSGLNLLASALQAKGKEAIEAQLGVKIPDRPSDLTPEKVMELRRAEMAHEEFLIDAARRDKELELEGEKAASAQVSERWRTDMTSDSWLSKNVRPLTLGYLTVAVTILAIVSPWLKVDPAWIELLKSAYLVVLSAYFVGRTVQHVVKNKERK